MSDVSDEMIRTLDRIVEDHVTVKVREAAEFGPFVPAGSDGFMRLPIELWKALDAAGFTQIAGTGLDGDVTFAEAMDLVRRSAYHALPVPLPGVILARHIVARARGAVPEVTFGLALVTPGQSVRFARSTTHGWQKDGDSLYVAGYGLVTSYLTSGRGDDGIERLAIVDPGSVTCIVDANEAGECRVLIPTGAVNSSAPQRLLWIAEMPGATDHIYAMGALLRAVQMAGAMDRVLEHCLTWVNDRVQFGKPIARFQAVQHLMAELAAETAAASAAADLAVEASAERADRFAIAVAKARTGEAAGRVAAIAHELFGAMGFTREHTLHYVTRRLWAWRNEFGSEAYWQGEIGRQIAVGGGASLWPTLTARG